MNPPPRIFVQIASYRDPECQWTVRDLFQKAESPDRIYVGICWQADSATDKDCFEVQTRPEQVRTVHFHPSETQGLGWARAQAESLWRGEEFVLQIDSHMRFVEGWDALLLDMLAECESDSPVLTVYPPRYTPPDNLEPDPDIRVQCPDHFESSGTLFFTAKPLPRGIEATRPIPTACFAGGFLFGASRIIKEVPSDPDIYFNGEEHAMAARLWTHGFDLFSPHKTVIYHYYKREEAPRHWSDHSDWQDRGRQTYVRLKQLLAPALVPAHALVELGPYGLGTARTLAEYEEYGGISFAGFSIASYAKSFPYVRTEDLTESLRTDHAIRVSDTAHLFIIDDRGLLFSQARGEIYSLNTAATYIWCALEDGADWDGLVKGIESLCDFDSDTAERSLINLIAHWHGQGVLAGSDEEDIESLPWRAKPPEIDAGDIVSDVSSNTFEREQTYQLLDVRFLIRYQDAEQEEWIGPAVSHLVSESGGGADHVLSVHRQGDVHHILLDGEPVFTGKKISQLAPLVKYQLLNIALDNHDHILNLHAGVVAKNGKLLAFPANSGDGKSTLVAALVAAGYQYFSDELAPLSRAACQVRPVPLAMCIKEGGLEALNQYASHHQDHVHDREDGKRVYYLPPPIDSMGALDQCLRIDRIVFPKYVPGAKTEIRSVPRMEAIRRLLEQCVSIPKPLSLDDAAVLVNWFEVIEAHELVSGSLAESVEEIDRLIG